LVGTGGERGELQEVISLQAEKLLPVCLREVEPFPGRSANGGGEVMLLSGLSAGSVLLGFCGLNRDFEGVASLEAEKALLMCHRRGSALVIQVKSRRFVCCGGSCDGRGGGACEPFAVLPAFLRLGKRFLRRRAGRGGVHEAGDGVGANLKACSA
jgi:hypothetical protein